MTIAETFEEHWDADPASGCWNWKRAKSAAGYGQLCLRRKMVKAHRFSYERSVGPVPQGMHVLHRCDNPSCVNPAHLFIGTHDDNMRDKSRKGRVRVHRGEDNHRAKISFGDAQRMRDIYRVGQSTQQQIAQYFGIDQTSVSLIVLNKARVCA